ncbi:unnamed protein product [Rhizoctonia solani]|uniref:DUF6535 domain-containing protein n=1 Tax=Rhizoctonia solani TaxID=456999 RepID=A0A8H3D027_9AGAM|nr:unnamed protein product [Rhizoctonia solani]
MDAMIPSRVQGKPKRVDETVATFENPSFGKFSSGAIHDELKNIPPRVDHGAYGRKPYVWDDNFAEVDEYGAELGKEARVWRVYVKETDRWDEELVDGWNKSLDVILVFAALFSAVSTAFIIESSKKLQQDPSDVTAETLISISQTLLIIANNTQSSPPVLVMGSEQDRSSFDPTTSAVIVNTLWYMSLSLSLATSLMAMLAKDWCHSFKSNRSGHPWSQTIRRQKKWAMIERWKMQELILVLPSLIHLSLLFFSIGLSIYVWDLNDAVAIPVICISGAALGFYILSSIAASSTQYFPYTTIISRIWISGFIRYLVRHPIKSAVKLVRQWLSVLRSIISFLATILSLWISRMDRWIKSSFKFFEEAFGYLTVIILSYIPPGCAQCCYWPYRTFIVVTRFLLLIPKYLISVLSVSNFKPLFDSRTKSPAMKVQEQDQIISEALSWLITNCETPGSLEIALQAIAGANPRIPREPLEDCEASMKILQRLISGSIRNENSSAHLSLYARAYEFLRAPTHQGTKALRTEVRGELEVMIWDLQSKNERSVTRLITEIAHYRRQSLRAIDYWTGSCLAICVLSQVDHGNRAPIDTHSYYEASSRSKKALSALVSHHDGSQNAHILVNLEFLTWIGFSVILSSPSNYGLVDYEAVRGSFVNLGLDIRVEATQRVKSLCGLFPLPYQEDRLLDETFEYPKDGNLGALQYKRNANLYLNDERWGISSYLRAIQQVYELTRNETPMEEVYVLVVEMIFRVRSNAAQELCEKLMCNFTFPTISRRLIRILKKRKIVPLLFDALDESRGPRLNQFAAIELWLLFISYLRSDLSTRDQNDLKQVLSERGIEYGIFSYEWEPEQVKDELEIRILGNRYDKHNYLGLYSSRVIECILESNNKPGDEELARTIKEELKDLPLTLRGLSSFIPSIPRKPPTPDVDENQPITGQPLMHLVMEIMPPDSDSDMT